MYPVSDYGLGFTEPIRGVILGARGGVGSALAEAILAAHPQNQLILTSRANEAAVVNRHERESWRQIDITREADWVQLTRSITDMFDSLNVVINSTGLLSKQSQDSSKALTVFPERALKDLSLQMMNDVFAVNTFGVGLALKYLTPLLPRKGRSLFASCSARVGSISDNRLGGWYSYRASKAAQNMLIKTAAIELSRARRSVICVGLHPGTVESDLSSPFTSNVKHTVFTPKESAAHLCKVLSGLEPEDSGRLFAWDGSIIPF
jgi:NAD(P)-dependent dehydrogenase (short-subunit alcohol dehydrogenase family)